MAIFAFRYLTGLRVALIALLSTFLGLTVSWAHEVQPGLMDLEFTGENTADVYVEWMIEAPVAGLDLDGITNTNAAEGSEEYDRLRALPADELNAAFQSAWPSIAEKLTFTAGETAVTPELVELSVPEVGNVELPRTSSLKLTLSLPEDNTPIVMGWSSEFGPLVVRQRNVEGGYAAFLTSGALSDQIPRTGTTEQTATEALVDYVSVGFDHIVPKGLDHILFVLGLFFLALRMGPLLWQITAFTLAHTVTLALGALDIIRLSGDIVEPLIAASIVYVGIENLFSKGLNPWRPVVVFAFGLLHGLGFAAVLQDFGLGSAHFIPKLIGFNVGVEIGQLAVIAAAFVTVGYQFGRFTWYKRRVAGPVSVAIALIALFWVFERTGMIAPDGPFALMSMLTEGGLPTVPVAATGIGIAVIATIAVQALVDNDALRDVAGAVTSAVLFLAIVATFTSGAWVWAIALAIVWLLAIRIQEMGGDNRIEAVE